MKKNILAVCFLLSSFSAIAADVKLTELTMKEVKDVSKEFATNFTHTLASAPSTNGLWGVEVGLMAATMSSPKLKDTINNSGGNGEDLSSLYSAGAFARVHIPFEFFFEMSVLPEIEVAEVKLNNTTFGVGWNVGRFFNLPLDISLGYDVANGEMSFTQLITDPAGDVNSKFSLESATQKAWVGVSKKFLFFTPYAKVGVINMNSTLKGEGSVNTPIFEFSADDKKKVSESGTYMAAGLQFDFLVFSLGLEAMSALDNERYAAKFAFSF